jgi:hypothetical protein
MTTVRATTLFGRLGEQRTEVQHAPDARRDAKPSRQISPRVHGSCWLGSGFRGWSASVPIDD